MPAPVLPVPSSEPKLPSSWKPAFKPLPRSSVPRKPMYEELLFMTDLLSSPIFWCSTVVLIRPYTFTLLWARAADVPQTARTANIRRVVFVMLFPWVGLKVASNLGVRHIHRARQILVLCDLIGVIQVNI